MTADLAGPGAATAPPWLTSIFERNDQLLCSSSAACGLPGGTAAAAAAREFTARTLRDWGFAHLADDVRVVVSELVTNALRHAPSSDVAGSAGQLIELRLVNHRFHLVCAVRDPSERVPEVVNGSADSHADSHAGSHADSRVTAEQIEELVEDDLAETGRGLHLVEALAATWGWVLTGHGGKIVWALFDASRA
jgi:anti-sigma regulatory factor (Ser/Thr protein kinase)